MSFIVVTSLGWNHPDGTNLFNNISFACSSERTGLTGNNGTGKSILAQIIAGKLSPANGYVETSGTIAYLPQNVSGFSENSIVGLFGVAERYAALQKIFSGSGTNADYEILNDDWQLDERLHEALESTGISYINPRRCFNTLSGGEQIRCVFASLLFNTPDFLILDEPTNHLDEHMRQFVYMFVREFKGGMLIISHDRELLRQMDKIIELTPGLAKSYGGNYDFYDEQKLIERKALEDDSRNAEARLDKRVNEMQTALQRQAVRTKHAAEKAKNGGILKAVIHKRKGKAEQTASNLKKLHEKRVENEQKAVDEARQQLPVDRRMILDFTNTKTPDTEKIVLFDNVNIILDGHTPLWKEPVSFSLLGNDRLHLQGANGSGKSTLMKLITGELEASEGTVFTGVQNIAYLDQNTSLLDDTKTILENVLAYAHDAVPEHELRIRLARLLFFNEDVHKKVSVLSGGERMRVGLACLFAPVQPPDLILLDEPTNNLDLKSVNEMTRMLNEYAGSLIIVSHDQDFIMDLHVNQQLRLAKPNK